MEVSIFTPQERPPYAAYFTQMPAVQAALSARPPGTLTQTAIDAFGGIAESLRVLDRQLATRDVAAAALSDPAMRQVAEREIQKYEAGQAGALANRMQAFIANQAKKGTDCTEHPALEILPRIGLHLRERVAYLNQQKGTVPGLPG